MKKNLYTTGFAFGMLFLLELGTGCERRPLEELIRTEARIPVRIDWSESAINPAAIHRVSIWLYPTDGGIPLEYRAEEEITYKEIQVPAGEYDVLIFNETDDPSDWTGVQFSGMERFERAAMQWSSPEQKGLQPLAVWSLEKFRVTPQMYHSDNAHTALSMVKPHPVFSGLQLRVQVENLNSAVRVTGKLNGMSAGVYLVSGARFPAYGFHPLAFSERIYDSDGRNGTIGSSFFTFGEIPVAEAVYTVQLDFLLTDGSLFSTPPVDVTGRIVKETAGALTWLKITLGTGDTENDPRIVLPRTDINPGISVGDWNEITKPLK